MRKKLSFVMISLIVLSTLTALSTTPVEGQDSDYLTYYYDCSTIPEDSPEGGWEIYEYDEGVTWESDGERLIINGYGVGKAEFIRAEESLAAAAYYAIEVNMYVDLDGSGGWLTDFRFIASDGEKDVDVWGSPRYGQIIIFTPGLEYRVEADLTTPASYRLVVDKSQADPGQHTASLYRNGEFLVSAPYSELPDVPPERITRFFGFGSGSSDTVWDYVKYEVGLLPLGLSLHIEDALEGVTVNKVVRDLDGPAPYTLVEIVAKLLSYTPSAMDDIPVVLTIPGDLFGPPLFTFMRNTNGGQRWLISYDDLGSGQYGVTTDLSPFTYYDRLGFPQTAYRKQIMWVFVIPNDISPQDVTVHAQIQIPCVDPSGTGTIRILEPGSSRSIIIANRKLLYDNFVEREVNGLLQRLYTEAQGPPASNSPVGVIYYVDYYSSVAGNWDNTAVDYTSETTANEAANAIDELIEDWWLDAAIAVSDIPVSVVIGPPYLLIVGDDNTIPFYRYDDPTDTEGIERILWYLVDGWPIDSADNPAINATDEDYILTDNPYADLSYLTWTGEWQDGDIELWVGRLLGASAADMLTLLEEGVNVENGRRGNVVMTSLVNFDVESDVQTLFREKGFEVRNDDIPPTEVLTINIPEKLLYEGTHQGPDNSPVLYDPTKTWLEDALINTRIDNIDTERIGGINDNAENTLTTYTAIEWNTGDSYKIIGYEGGNNYWNLKFKEAANHPDGMDLFFIGGHNEYYHADIPGDAFTPDDTPGEYTRFGVDHPIVMIMGCHGGLPVPDVGLIEEYFIYSTTPYRTLQGGVDHSMVYDVIHEGARAYIGATVFTTGDLENEDSLLFIELLTQAFFEQLLEPSSERSKTIGEALTLAKKDYVLGYGIDGAWDRKTVTGTNLYGVPWAFIYYPNNPEAATLDAATGVQMVSTSEDSYSLTFEVDVDSYEAETETRDGIEYHLFSVEGDNLAISDGAPILPYMEGYTLALPPHSTVTEVQMVEASSSSIGDYNIPIAKVRPLFSGGLSYTTESDINYLYPLEEELVQYQETGEGLLFNIFPIRHNPLTDETNFINHLTVQVTYEAPLSVAVSKFSTEKAEYLPGETIGTTARIINVGDIDSMLTATLTIKDVLGQVVGTKLSEGFIVPSGGSYVLPLEWSGILDDGAYALQITIYEEGSPVGGALEHVSVVSGAITEIDTPTMLLPGEECTIHVTFTNYLLSEVSALATLSIQHDGFIEDLNPQDITVAGHSSETVAFSWMSMSGDYNVIATIVIDDQTYGPQSKSFKVLTPSEFIEVIDTYIQELPDAAFKDNPDQQKKAFSNKLFKVKTKIEAGDIQEAINKLQNDIQAKADGYLDGKSMDDWITNPVTQEEFCSMIDDLLNYLRKILAS